MKLPMVVTFTVSDEHLAFVKSELLKILEPTRKEKGCLLYELHEDLDNPNILMFYEVWETVEDWKRHDTESHILAFKEATKGKFESVEFRKLKIL